MSWYSWIVKIRNYVTNIVYVVVVAIVVIAPIVVFDNLCRSCFYFVFRRSYDLSFQFLNQNELYIFVSHKLANMSEVTRKTIKIKKLRYLPI